MAADTNEMAMRTTRTTHGKHAHTHVKKQAKKKMYVLKNASVSVVRVYPISVSGTSGTH